MIKVCGALKRINCWPNLKSANQKSNMIIPKPIANIDTRGDVGSMFVPGRNKLMEVNMFFISIVAFI